MFFIQNLDGHYWDGTSFKSLNQSDAMKYSSFMEATTKASDVQGLVSDADKVNFSPMLRMYYLHAVNNKSSAHTELTTLPFTHEQCCVMKSKLTNHAGRSIMLQEVNYVKVHVEELEGISLIWSAAVCAGLKVDMGMLVNKKVIVHEGAIFNPIEDSAQTERLLKGFDVKLYPDSACQPKAVYTPFKSEPRYWYQGYGENIVIAAIRCFVRSKTGRSDHVRIPKWLLSQDSVH